MLLRKFIGWGLGVGFVLLGARWRAVRQYDREGAILSFCTHNPKPEVLEGVLAWLAKRGFSFISTEELLQMREGALPWRRRCAWVTFDDGWEAFEEACLPILERYHCPVTLFVSPKEIERGQVWTNSIFAETKDMRPFYGLPAEERYAQVDAILARIGNPRRLATAETLQRLERHPLVRLENHTYTHLSCHSRPLEEVMAEVNKTQAILNAWTGRTPMFCCYPFGHHTQETDQALEGMGVIPVTLTPGVMTLDGIGKHRNMMYDTVSVTENLGRILGAWVRVKPTR